MASNLMFVKSNLDNRGEGTGPGTPNWVQVSLYSNIIRSEEDSNFTILELFELDYKHATILIQTDNFENFNDNLTKLENIVSRAEIKY